MSIATGAAAGLGALRLAQTQLDCFCYAFVPCPNRIGIHGGKRMMDRSWRLPAAALLLALAVTTANAELPKEPEKPGPCPVCCDTFPAIDFMCCVEECPCSAACAKTAQACGTCCEGQHCGKEQPKKKETHGLIQIRVELKEPPRGEPKVAWVEDTNAYGHFQWKKIVPPLVSAPKALPPHDIFFVPPGFTMPMPTAVSVFGCSAPSDTTLQGSVMPAVPGLVPMQQRFECQLVPNVPPAVTPPHPSAYRVVAVSGPATPGCCAAADCKPTGADAITLRVKGSQVSLCTSTLCATAENVRMTSKHVLELEGHACVAYQRDGQCVEVCGDKIVVNRAGDQLEVVVRGSGSIVTKAKETLDKE